MLADPPPFNETFRPGGVRLLLTAGRDGVDGRPVEGEFVFVGVVGRLVFGFDVGVVGCEPGVVGRLVDGRVVCVG